MNAVANLTIEVSEQIVLSEGTLVSCRFGRSSLNPIAKTAVVEVIAVKDSGFVPSYLVRDLESSIIGIAGINPGDNDNEPILVCNAAIKYDPKAVYGSQNDPTKPLDQLNAVGRLMFR